MKYIAHRGLSSKAPENTIAAFELAAKESRYFGIECDVHSTKDGEFVVFHDDDLKRMANLSLKISEIEYQMLSNILILSGKNIKQFPNEKIPHLRDFLNICNSYKKTAVIEIKKIHQIDMLQNLIDLLDEYPELNKIIISFNRNYLKYLKAISNIPLQLLSDYLNDEIIYDARVNQLNLSLNYKILNSSNIKKLKKEGFEVATYTVDYKKDAQLLEKLGVKYLTTNKL
jgi:glycerophosphoryl diester phosphodiesterase